jgi:type VI protein secretion system component VasF
MLAMSAVPESRARKKAPFTPPSAKSAAPKPNARWFVPVMVGLLVLGLMWIVVFYVSQTSYPVQKIGYWNLAIGFTIMLSGFAMTTRWR